MFAHRAIGMVSTAGSRNALPVFVGVERYGTPADLMLCEYAQGVATLMRTSCHIRVHFVRSSRAGPSSRSGKCCNNSADFVDSCTSCRSTGIAKAFRVVSGRACYKSWKNGRTNGGLGLCCIPIWYAHSLSQLLLLSINNNTIDRERISSLDGHIAGEASTWTIPPDLFKSVTSLFPYLALCGLYQSFRHRKWRCCAAKSSIILVRRTSRVFLGNESFLLRHNSTEKSTEPPCSAYATISRAQQACIAQGSAFVRAVVEEERK